MTKLAQLLLSDARFPAGGYAHSGGLEAAVAAGLGTAGVGAFVFDRLTAVAVPEAMLMVAAARAARNSDVGALLVLDEEADARTPSPPLRTAARRLGAQLLRSAATVWPGEGVLAAYRAASATTPRPIAFGVVATQAGLDDRESVEVYLYEEAAMVTGAAVRLLPIDAVQTVRYLAGLEARLAELADRVVAVRCAPAEIPAAFAPAYELLSLAHSDTEGRLFAS